MAQRLEKSRGFCRSAEQLSPAIQDALWKAMQRHEKKLEEKWLWKWEFLLNPEYVQELRANPASKQGKREGKACQYQDLSFHSATAKVSKPRIVDLEVSLKQDNLHEFPRTAAQLVGWRSADSHNSLERFSLIPRDKVKTRLVPEMYGFYRQMKLAEHDNQEVVLVPSRRIKHLLVPILS